MIVRMVHPEHGATHVYDVLELERHRALGWVPEGEKPAEKEPEAPELAALPVVDPVGVRVVAESVKRKPGRPRKVQ